MALDVTTLTVEQALAISMNSEIDSERVYRKLGEMVHNFVLREKMAFLISEEKKHQKIIRALFDKLAPNLEMKLTEQRIYPGLNLVVEESATVTDLLEAAMEAEKAAEEFFDALSQEAEERGVQEILQYLASMEHSHYFLLKGEYDLCMRDESYYEREDFQFDMVHIGP
ncbi:MAG TPA: hypothetical protein ENN17_06590 [bacterium]|nr:hypothetical protein [bacterium]